MNDLVTAGVAVFELSLVGELITIDEDFLRTPAAWQAMSAGQTFNLSIFVILYILFIVLSLSDWRTARTRIPIPIDRSPNLTIVLLEPLRGQSC